MTRLMRVLLVGFVAALVTGLTSCSLSHQPQPTTQAVNLREGLGLSQDEGWIVLARPNSLWTVGTVIEDLGNGAIRDLGTLKSIGCFPDSAWVLEPPGKGPSIQYGRAIDYGMSVSATLGIPKAELAKVGLSFGGDGEVPTHKSIVVLNKVTEHRVNSLRAEEFLQANYESMSPACKRNVLDPTRYIIDKILVVEDGELRFEDAAGAKVDLSTPRYQFITDAALKAGYSATKNGSLKVNDQSPVTFAVRQSDFGSTLARMGIKRRGNGKSLEAVLLEAGEAIPIEE